MSDLPINTPASPYCIIVSRVVQWVQLSSTRGGTRYDYPDYLHPPNQPDRL